MPSSEPAGSRLLVAVGVLCGLEAVALLVLAGVEVTHAASGRAVIGVTTAIFFALYAVALALAGRGIARGRSWARAPIVLAQLIQLGLGWSFYGPGTYWVTALLGVPALFALIVLLLPSTTVALYGQGEQPTD